MKKTALKAAATKLATAGKAMLFPVAGVGASAGGLDAFKALLKAIPDNAGIAWILVQHQYPKHESRLTEILQKLTALPVAAISNNTTIKPDHIFVMPANKLLTVKAGKMKLASRTGKGKAENNYPINLFFGSLAEMYEGNAIGVVLSGTGTDGTGGLRTIKNLGGITIAQNTVSAAYPAMPESAVIAGVVDFVLAPEDIPGKLLEIKKIIHVNEEDAGPGAQEDKSFKEILSLLHRERDMDFTYYKQNTIRRRIIRRMLLNKFEKITQYAASLHGNTAELQALYQDMLIPVTGFFRDRKVFENLCETVFPNLIKNKTADGIIRIWVVGCSTGEEAYSIAICFKEYLGQKMEKVQIFATDLSEPAIAKARSGIYTKAEVEAVSDQRLKRFFTISNGQYHINKDLRSMCVFAVHNFLKDPPFVKIDFISCRNVLIYMDAYLQKKALTTFHYALTRKGLLMLGKSENTIGIADFFITSNKTEKIFTRKNIASKIPFLAARKIENTPIHTGRGVSLQMVSSDFQKMASDIMLAKYTPAAVIVNQGLDIVYFSGNTSLYLEQTAGRSTHNILKLAKPGLAFELRSLLQNAVKGTGVVKKEHLRVQVTAETQQIIALEVFPLAGIVEPHWLVIFNDIARTGIQTAFVQPASRNKKDSDTIRLHQLEMEMLQLKEDMRRITEEQEASNEELQNTNEELQSSNEELQSLNEELETSKEELQSTVEELTVVNQEIVNLNEQLVYEKDYAEAIIATIPQPLLVLDKDLRVLKANQLFYDKFSVTPSQTEGQLIYETGNKQWNIPQLRLLLEAILPKKESFFGFEVEHDFGATGPRFMRLNAREITGTKSEKKILLAIEDVTDYVRAVRTIKEAEHRYSSMIYSSPFMIAILEGQNLIIKDANEAILATWGSGKEIIGQPLASAVPGSVERGSYARIKQVYDTGEPYYGYELPVPIVRNGKEELRYYTYIYQAQKNINGTIEGVAILANEVTPQAIFNRKMMESEEKFRTMAESADILIGVNNETVDAVYFNKNWEKLTGRSVDDLLKLGWADLLHPEDRDTFMNKFLTAFKNKESYEGEYRILTRDGNYSWLYSKVQVRLHPDGSYAGHISSSIDITARKQQEKALRESETKYRNLFETMEQGFCIIEMVFDEAGVAVDYLFVEVNPVFEKQTGLTNAVEKTAKELVPELEGHWFKTYGDVAKTGKSAQFIEGSEAMGRWFHVYAFVSGEERNRVAVLFTDISERRKTEKKLQESEQYFRRLTDTVPSIIWITEPDGYCSYLNKNWYEYTGQTEKEGEGYGWLTATHPDDVAAAGEAFVKANMEQQPFSHVYRLKTKNGGYRWAIDRGAPKYSAGGKYEGMIGTVVDIHDEKIASDKIKESELRFRNLLQEAPVAATLFRGPGLIIEIANELTLKYWGKNKDIIGMPVAMAAPELQDQRMIDLIKDIYQQGGTANFSETPITFIENGVLKEGYYTHSLKAMYDSSGNVEAVLGISIDVTEQVKTRKQIEESEAFNRNVLENSPDCVQIIDTGGRIQYINANGLRIMEIEDFLAVKQKPWTGLWGEENKIAVQDAVEKALLGEKIQFQVFCPTAKSTPKWWDVMVSPVLETGSANVTSIISVSRDITSQKEVQSLLEYRKALLEAHNQVSFDGILLVDAKGKIISYNHKFTEIWNMPQEITAAKDDEAALSFAMTQLVHPGQFIEKVKYLYEHPTETSTDILEFKDGKIVERHGYPVIADDGTYYAWSWTFRDITEQKYAELKLTESEKQLRKTTEHFEIATTAAEVGTWSLDLSSKTLVWSGLHKKMWGYDENRTDLLYEDWHKIILPGDKEAAFAEVEKALKAKTLYEAFYRIKRADNGTIRWILSTGQYFYNEAGEAVTLTGVSMDITERQQAEIALKDSEKRFRLLAELVPAKISNAGADGKLVYFNQNWLDYTGFTLEELKDFGYRTIMHPDEVDKFEELFRQAAAAGTVLEMEMRFLNRQGEYKWHLNLASPVKDEKGDINMWIGATIDIQKIKEEEQRKGDFIKLVSHELKTPITSIKGYVQFLLGLLKGQPESNTILAPVKSSLIRIDIQIARLTRLITEMLDLSRIESGKLELHKRRFSLNELVTETIQDVSHTTTTHTIDLQNDFVCEIIGDRDRLGQVLINFITNAVKYSPESSTITVRIFDAGSNLAGVSVKDFGIGISKDEQGRIFERFYRVEGKKEEVFAGFGIGLFIANEIIQKHEGTITVDSDTGTGSVFTFIVPLNI